MNGTAKRVIGEREERILVLLLVECTRENREAMPRIRPILLSYPS
jgi:hypothetical protein